MPQTRITLPTADGTMDCQAFAPAGEKPSPGVILYMDALGIRPEMETMAERLASNGYVVLLPNLFYRAGPFAPFDPATVFRGGPEHDRMMALIQSTSSAMTMRDTSVCLDYLDRQPTVRGRSVGVTGYCMGGRAAMIAAGTFPDRVAAAGIFHAGRLTTNQPDSPHRLAEQIRAKLYIAVAALDQMFSSEERERLRQALENAGVRFTLEVYPNVAHGFAVPGLPVYNPDAAERHWRALLRLLAETLPSGTQT